jgi:type I restriction-modification system DNA methylase subunit
MKNDKIKLSQLESFLMKAADILRGKMDAPTIQPILEYLALNAYKETPYEEWLAAKKAN